MKRIEFRAWNKEFEKMSYYGFEAGDEIYVESGDKEFMLSIGLKDSTGKTIYDKDILETPSGTYLIHIEMQHGLRAMFGKDNMSAFNATFGKVIGNLYQNPVIARAYQEAERND